MSNFIIIAITKPELVDDEAGKITRLLDNGVDFVHIRKPGSSIREVKDLIEEIPYRLRRHLKLHGHFELLNDFNLGGAHVNSRCPEAPATAASVSKSCHSLDEIDLCKGMAYVTLSPVYDSISKPGYRQAFKPESLTGKIEGKNVIALGGVTPSDIPELKRAGFAGCAMLGAVWEDIDRFISLLKKNN